MNDLQRARKYASALDAVWDAKRDIEEVGKSYGLIGVGLISQLETLNKAELEILQAITRLTQTEEFQKALAEEKTA